METAYERAVNCVFHLSPEERHRLFERMSDEYLGVDGDFQHCSVCNTKQIEWVGWGVDIPFSKCHKFKECRRWRCDNCIGDGHDYLYVCDYHLNITLRGIALMSLKFTKKIINIYHFNSTNELKWRPHIGERSVVSFN